MKGRGGLADRNFPKKRGKMAKIYLAKKGRGTAYFGRGEDQNFSSVEGGRRGISREDTSSNQEKKGGRQFAQTWGRGKASYQLAKEKTGGGGKNPVHTGGKKYRKNEKGKTTFNNGKKEGTICDGEQKAYFLQGEGKKVFAGREGATRGNAEEKEKGFFSTAKTPILRKKKKQRNWTDLGRRRRREHGKFQGKGGP